MWRLASNNSRLPTELAHNEGFVHAHEPFDPRIDEQIVADGNLYRIWKPGLDEPHVEEGGIKDYVAVIGNKGVAGRVRGDGTVVER